MLRNVKVFFKHPKLTSYVLILLGYIIEVFVNDVTESKVTKKENSCDVHIVSVSFFSVPEQLKSGFE